MCRCGTNFELAHRLRALLRLRASAYERLAGHCNDYEAASQLAGILEAANMAEITVDCGKLQLTVVMAGLLPPRKKVDVGRPHIEARRLQTMGQGHWHLGPLQPPAAKPQYHFDLSANLILWLLYGKSSLPVC